MPHHSPRPIPTLFPLHPPLKGVGGEKVWGGAMGGWQGQKNEKENTIRTRYPSADFRRQHAPVPLDGGPCLFRIVNTETTRDQGRPLALPQNNHPNWGAPPFATPPTSRNLLSTIKKVWGDAPNEAAVNS